MASLADEWRFRSADWVRWVRTPGHDRYYERFNGPSFLELVPPACTTLDLGCGEGRLGAILAQRGHVVTGLDASPDLAGLARERGVYADVVVGDAAALPFANGAFDCVVAFMSLQDMDDAAGAVREAARVLAPGGVLVAATVHPIASSGIARDDATERGYFKEVRTTDAIERDGIAFEFHQIHRSLQGFLGLFFAAGLVVEDVREPRPSQADVADDPPLGKNRARPAFLHLRCRHG